MFVPETLEPGVAGCIQARIAGNFLVIELKFAVGEELHWRSVTKDINERAALYAGNR